MFEKFGNEAVDKKVQCILSIGPIVGFSLGFVLKRDKASASDLVIEGENWQNV